MRHILLTLIAVSLLSLTPAPAQAWYPGQRLVQAVRGQVARGVERRQARRADGRGLGRLGIGARSGTYGGGCANGVCR